jgi:Protein of unknown function (DUF3108)
MAPIPFDWRRQRWRGALLVAALVLLLHGLLLGLLPRTPGPGWKAQQALSVRQIVAPAPAPVDAQPPAQLPAQAPAPQPKPRAERVPQKATAESAAAAPAADTEPFVPPESPPTSDPGGLSVPVYSTRPPSAALLRYEMRSGPFTAAATLTWRPTADSYTLELQGRAPPPIEWASRGGFDAAGIAPLRHTESRRGREVRAVNFQRDSGRITFSGPAVEHPLVPGAQDRLSWIVQLAAILNANPQLTQPQAQVSMWVAGSRGDAEVWTFTVVAAVALDLPAGPVPAALHLIREPRRPYDTQAQVWLDPARDHLPVQLLLRVRATGEGTQFSLLEHGP